jgi:Uma2 family endonuclease
VPDVLFEVRSPGDSSRELLDKINEYLAADIAAACVVDPEARTVTVYRAGRQPQVFAESDELVLPELHPDFRVVVRRLFGEAG